MFDHSYLLYIIDKNYDKKNFGEKLVPNILLALCRLIDSSYLIK